MKPYYNDYTKIENWDKVEHTTQQVIIEFCNSFRTSVCINSDGLYTFDLLIQPGFPSAFVRLDI